jgi:FkbM family methyltransferase
MEEKVINRVDLAIGGGESLSFNFDDADGLDTVAIDVSRSGLAYYEVPFPTVLGALVRLTDGDFYDVGANTGIFSLLAAAANPKIRVHSFEPVPYIARLLSQNVHINPELSERISLHRVALSDRDGSFTMMEHINPAGLVSTSSSLEIDLIGSDSEHQGIDVEVLTMDNWMRSNPGSSPAVMKVDVEGHERAVFAGAQYAVKRFRPFIIVELLGGADFDYFESFLKENKYCDIALFPGSATLQKRPAFLPQAWNHLFCPEEHLWSLATVCGQIGLPIS